MRKLRSKKQSIEIAILQPKIILNRLEVDEYVEKQKKKNEIVTLDDSIDSHGQDANSSIVFVSEERASAEVKKIRELYKTIYQQEDYIRRLKLHVKALQNVILNENKATNAQQIDQFAVPNEDENQMNAFDLTFDDDWVERQINEWRTNGELSKLCEDFVQFITEQNVE